MSDIVIGIACHKPSELPNNPLYLPIHVGAALAAKPLEGCQPDSTGDNISEKNPMYCELTAQYWLWKNVDADYYGLCHYRRFMSFAPTKFTHFTTDNRRQVLVESLNDRTKEVCCLENEQVMRDLIEQYDIVATEEQDLTHVFTPRGHKRSVYDHFAAHDRDLINVHDLDRMIAITEAKYPEFAADMKEYISRPYFRGFNCFVMRRELFFELCEMEFDVLGELEGAIDFSTYDLTRTRIYGFMAEILYSSFVYHVKKRRGARVCDVQMLYFVDSDKKEPIHPVPGAIPVVFSMINAPALLFEVTQRSFAKHLSPDRTYDVIVLYTDKRPYFWKSFQAFFDKLPNVTVRFLDWQKIERALWDELDTFTNLPTVYLPWVLAEYDRAIWMNWNVLFEGDWSALADVDFEGNLIAAAQDIELQGEANNMFTEYLHYVRDYLGIKDPYNCFDMGVLAMDFAAIRRELTVRGLHDRAESFQEDLPLNELMNVLFEGRVKTIGQEWNLKVSTDPEVAAFVNDAPFALFKEYQAAKKNPIIVQYDTVDPWWLTGAAHEEEFWEFVRESGREPFFVELMIASHTAMRKTGRTRKGPLRWRLDRALPKGSKRRAALKKLFPHGSTQYRLVKGAVSKIAN